MKEIVSILIPAFNARRWIKDTIESALAQTWPNKEVIIVDDGSIDETYQIAKKYESHCVKVISQENAGSGAARNRALELSQGSLIQWLDHDDLLHADKIRAQVEGSGIKGDGKTVSSSAFGRFYYRTQCARFVSSEVWQNMTPIEYLLSRFRHSAWFQTGAWLVSRKVTEMAGPWLELRTPDDDGEYFCRIVGASNEIKFVPSALSYWRVGNPRSLSRRDRPAIEALFTTRTICINHFRALEDTPRIRAACVQYLQNSAADFYLENKDIFRKAQMLARQLGGEINEPKVIGKYSALQYLIGYRTAMIVRGWYSVKRVAMAREWDRCMYKLGL